MTPAEPNRPNASAPGFALAIPLSLMVLPTVVAVDRYVSNNPESRDVLFQLPDATLGRRLQPLGVRPL